MKHLLSGAIGAMIGVILMWLWWTGAGCSEERATITALSQRNEVAQLELGQVRHELRETRHERNALRERQTAQWEAKLVQHRLAKTQRELGEQLAQKVGKIDDVMPVKVQAVSKVDEEVERITALAKRLVPVEAAVKEVAKQQDSFLPVPWLKQQIMNSAKLAGGRWR